MNAARSLGRIRQRFSTARGGAAAVEFVLVLPLMAVLLFGSIDLGRLLADYQAAGQAVRYAARYLARADPAALGLDCGAGVIDETSVPALAAMHLAMTGTVDGSGAYVLDYWINSASLAAAGLTVSVQCEDNGGGAFGRLYEDVPMVPSLRLSAAIPFPLLDGWLLGRGGTLTFTVHHREPHVGGRWGI